MGSKPASDYEIASPMRGSVEGYQQARFISFQQMGSIIQSMQSWNDPRVQAMTLHDISSISDDELRDLAFRMLDELIAKHTAGAKTDLDKGKGIFRACMEMQGHVTAFYDEFTGVTHRLKIGHVAPPPAEEEEDEEPDERTGEEPARGPVSGGEPGAALRPDSHVTA